VKRCPRCREEKPPAEAGYCRPCRLEYGRRWREAHPGRMAAYGREWRAKRRAEEPAEAALATQVDNGEESKPNKKRGGNDDVV
jgi:hypothetical protein